MTSWVTDRPSIASAAVRPCSTATSKCSTRARRPCSGESYSAASPAAYTPGSDVSSDDEHAKPPRSPSSIPADRASSTSGTTPAPITTQPQSIDRPPAVTTRATRPSDEPSNRSTSSRPCTSTPCETNCECTNRPTSGPRWFSQHTSSSITSDT